MFKLSKLIATGIFSTLLAFPLTTKAEEHPLVGVNYPPLPEKLDEIGGWSINGPYVVDQVSLEGQELLLLSRLIGRDSRGKASFQVVNVLSLPPMNVETEELLAGSLCSVNGQNDPNVIVIIKSEDSNTPFLTKARKAWRVEDEQFNEINVKGLRFKCENFTYGL